MRFPSARRAATVLLLVLVAATAAAGCGRSSMVGRRVDDFSAYYNKFYNARQTFNEATQPLDELDQSVDLGVYLPVFVPPTQVQNEDAFSKTIDKSADLLRTHPGSKWVDDALLLIGKSYFYQENYVGGERKFREVVGRNGPLEGEARFWLGRALLAGGDLSAAEQHLAESLQADSLSERWMGHMRLLLGQVHVRQGMWTPAADLLERGVRGVRDGQTRARALFLRGQVLETMGRYADATRAYRSAAEERPRYELAYAAETSALRTAVRAGGRRQERAVFEQLRRLERDDKNRDKRPALALLRGQLYQAQGRPGRARRSYESSPGAGRSRVGTSTTPTGATTAR
ncbi:MAG: hypothetical protein BRD38_04080 [Bacteroidetes bacterium QH_9_67_14]|nr:MAG: hypothetical protein BRD38_04080 [Bacteroidetes bacterium QH_9_67_14]